MSRSLKRTSQIAGGAIIAAMVLTVAVGAYGVNNVRFGGPLYKRDAMLGDFKADIAPPPLALLEPMLFATLLVEEANEGKTTAEGHIKRLAELERSYNDARKLWGAAGLDDDTNKVLDGRINPDSNAFWDIVDSQLVPAVRQGDLKQLNAAHDQLGTVFRRQEAEVHDLLKRISDRDMQNAAAASSSTAVTVATISAFVLALMGLIGCALVLLNRKVLTPIDETADVMHRMGQGDLDAGRRSDHRDDEIGTMTRAIEVFRESAITQREAQESQRQVVDALSAGLGEMAAGNLAHRMDQQLAPEYEVLRATFNQTIGDLAALIQRIHGSAQGVATGAGEIRAASDDLAMRNEQQAASLEETAAAMNQVTGIVHGTAKNAGEVQRSINEAHREATEGGEVVVRAVSAMAAIEKSSEEISQIINVIDGISFQTNLLALNAGVEAARAGDAGKGFAVVANEVRALAQRSADAAKDIKDLITASTEQVAGGVKLVGETGELLSKIVSRVGEINTMVTEIASSTEHQATSLQQVNVSVSEMDRMTQQNAAMVEQSTAAARSLADEANQLTEMVSQFRTGAAASATPIRRPAAKAFRRPTQVAAASGNLALASTPHDDDWTEF